jgi:hypothetical protein
MYTTVYKITSETQNKCFCHCRPAENTNQEAGCFVPDNVLRVDLAVESEKEAKAAAGTAVGGW